MRIITKTATLEDAMEQLQDAIQARDTGKDAVLSVRIFDAIRMLKQIKKAVA